MPHPKISSPSDFLQDNVGNDHLSSYSAWRGLLHSYSTLRKESIVVKDTKRLRYLRNQIVWNYLKNFFYFPILLFRLLTPSFMKGRVNIWTNLKTIATTREFRPLRMAVLMQCVFLYALGHLGYIVFHNYAIPTYAATFTWVQNSWSGGATTTVANHPGNQTSWNSYTAASSTITAGASVALSPETVSGVFTDASDFLGGVFDQVENSLDESIALETVVADVNRWNTQLQGVPDNLKGGMHHYVGEEYIYTLGFGFIGRYSISNDVWTASAPAPNTSFGSGRKSLRYANEDSIFVTNGSINNTDFYRYSISGNSWTTLANVPTSTNAYSVFVRDGNNDFIYFLKGNISNNFYRYSISGNSWETLPVVPGNVSYGATMVFNGDSLYVLQGGGTTGFYRYSISGNSWETLPVVPGNVSYGWGNLIYFPGEDFMYVSQGNAGTGFYRYSISGNSWSTLTVFPSSASIDGLRIRNNNDDFIYFFPKAASSRLFYRYSISGNSWTSRTSLPDSQETGSYMSSGQSYSVFLNDFIYVINGGSYSLFHRYSISGNSWVSSGVSNLAASPVSFPNHRGVLFYDRVGDFIYMLRGNTTPSIYRYSISGNSWLVRASAPGNFTNQTKMIGLLNHDYLYILQAGGSANFYRYSTSGNSWTTLTAAPGNISTGSQVIFNGDSIYVLQGGNATGFYRYSVSGNSWETLPVVPVGATTGSQMIRNGNEDFIYVLPGSSSSFYRYSISGNSWTQLSSVPFGVTINAGSQMIRNGSDNDIYIHSGSNNNLYRYSISGNSWTQLPSPSGGAGTANSIFRVGDDNYIYFLPGGSSIPFFYRYSISGNSWTSLTFPPTAYPDLFVQRDSDATIFTLQRIPQAFHKFTIQEISYLPSGTYTSPVFDTAGHTGFTTLSYTSSTPGNTILTIDVRAGDTVTPDETWTSWQTGISTGGDISALGTRRYIQYRANLSTTNNARTPELADLTLQYGRYTSGSLVSTPYNANDASNVFGSISWSESETPGTSVTFQVRTSPNSATWTDWTGPDGTSATVFTDSTGAQDMPAIFNDSQDDQWMQYRMTLTGSGASTPTVSDVTVTYVVNAPPDIAIVTSTPMVQSSAGVVALSYLVRDIDTSVGVTPGTVDIDLQYCTSNCASVGNEVWETAASSSLTGTYGEAISIQAEDYTEYSLIWDPTISLPGHYNGTDFKIRLRANDSEAANNYGYDESNTFTLDTADPVVSMSIDGRNDAPYNLTLAVTDDTTAGLEMKLSNNSDLSPDGLNPGSGTWVPYLTTSTWDFPLGGTTVYYQVRDAYSNVSASGAISQAQTPAVPDSIVYRDVSNSETEEWREFIAWGVVPLPGPGFDEYTLWRSTDGGVTYTELTTQADRLINYYIDDNLSTETTYYYRVSVTDSDGNISNYSRVASDRPDGQGGSDDTGPTISNVTSTALGTETVTITWDTDELSDSTVDYMTDTGGDFSNAESIGLTAMVDSESGLGQHTVTISGLTPATTYYYRVRSEDPQSNEGVSTEDPDGYTFTTLSGPSITDVAISRISNTDATITWTTDQSSDSYVYYSTSTDFSSPTLVGLANNTFEHEITLGSLSLGTTYYFYVQSGVGVDKNVVLGEIQYYTFTTTNDVTAPVLTFDSETDVTVSDESISLSWVTDEIATSTVEYGTSNEYGTMVINANLNTNHSFTLDDLLPGTLYYLRIRSTDAHGNRSGATEFTATTIDTADYVAPVISNVNASVVTDNDALIVWDTDENATGQVHYGTATTLYTDSSDLVSTYNRAHAITLSDLSTSTLYYYVVVSADSSGNSTTSSEYTFTTLEALSEESEVELREQAAAEAARAEGILEGTSSRRGGGGGASVDRTAPVVSGVSVEDITGSSATIVWESDDAGDSIVQFGMTTDYDRAAVDLTDVVSHRVLVVELKPETTYYYQVSTADSFGNRSQFLTGEFTTLSTLEEIVTIPDAESELPPEEVEDLFVASIQKASDIIRALSSQVSVGVLESTLLSQSAVITELSSLLPLPIIGGQPVVETGSNYATVSWTTDKLSNSLVEYAPADEYLLTGGYSQTVGNFDVSTNEHTVEVRGLTPNTLYHYRVISRTPTGAETRSRDFTFRTKNEFSEISNYKIEIFSADEASFFWATNLPTDTVISYTPYRNGVLDSDSTKIVRKSEFVTEHLVVLSGFEAGVVYDVEFSGTDYGGNTVSKLVKGFSTNETDVAPLIYQIQTDSAIIPGGQEKIQVIISWNTNELSTSRVLYRKGFASDDTPFTDSTLLDTEYVRKHIVVISNFESGQVYQFAVESTDSGGNTAVSKTITILTPRKEESVFQVIMSNVEDIFSWTTKLRR